MKEPSDPQDSDDYSLDEQIGYLMRLASQRHAAIFFKHAQNDLTPTQFSALIRVAELGETSQNQLGRLSAMDVATIKGVVDRLKAKSLVQTRTDPDDRRRSIISLTPNGTELIASLKETGRVISRETLAPLSEAEQKRLLKILRKLI